MESLDFCITDSQIKPIFEEKLFFIQQYRGKMDSNLQEILQEAKSKPVLVRICQLFESILLDFNQKFGKNARITELEKKNQNLKKVSPVTWL